MHGVGGILGALLTGVFASNALGVFSGQEDIAIGAQVSTQAIGIVSSIVYTAVVTYVILKVTRLVGNRSMKGMQGLDLVLTMNGATIYKEGPAVGHITMGLV